MIKKIGEMKNGYILDDDTTNQEWREFAKSLPKINCIICNSKTSLRFRPSLLGNNIITVNNKLLDNVVYINGVF